MIFRVFILLLGALSPLAHTYYVASSGHDGSDGTSSATAWKTIGRVNALTVRPGDRILFEGGQTFAGTLVLSWRAPISTDQETFIGSFGQGFATISAAFGNGIVLTNISHITLENQAITGSGSETNSSFGLLCENASTNSALENLRLRGLQVSGFGKHGIMITGQQWGFKHVRIEDCVMHHNRRGGIEVAGRLRWDAKEYAHADVVIRRCQAYDNTGDPLFSQNHSGSGIVVYQVNGGLIESCSAWNNGALCPASGGGPVGIWMCAARGVVIQNCESFGNKTRGLDGGGFDIDGGCENCVLQYSFSHDNIGPGLMVYTYPYASYRDRGNVVRFNVSINDAVNSNRYAGLWVRADGRAMQGVSIYNNTVITSGRYAAFIFGQDVEADFQNNLLITNTNGTPVAVEGGHSKITFQNNALWRNGAPFHTLWNQRVCHNFADWQVARGTSENLLFTDPGILLSHASGLIGLSNLVVLRPRSAAVLTNGIPTIPSEVASVSSDILNHRFHDTILPIGAIGAP